MESAPAYSAPAAFQQQQQQQPQVTYVQVPQDGQQHLQYIEKGPMTQTIPMQPQPQNTIVQPTFQPRVYNTATPLNVLGRTGAPADCPACGQRSMTRTVTVVGNTNHAWAGAICLLTGFCCFIPYLMDSMKDVEHRCGSCGVLLATVHKSGRVDVHQHH